MAIYFRGLTTAETTALTLAMRDSGDVLKFPRDKRPLVDKHSTGGIGDKVSLPLAPLLACLGFRVPMISGRGLGITGGTLDKLDSIPGFKTLLPTGKIIAQVQKTGCVICGQTDCMAPADRKIATFPAPCPASRSSPPQSFPKSSPKASMRLYWM
jgi:thymidine phosphorylase